MEAFSFQVRAVAQLGAACFDSSPILLPVYGEVLQSSSCQGISRERVRYSVRMGTRNSARPVPSGGNPAGPHQSREFRQARTNRGKFDRPAPIRGNSGGDHRTRSKMRQGRDPFADPTSTQRQVGGSALLKTASGFSRRRCRCSPWLSPVRIASDALLSFDSPLYGSVRISFERRQFPSGESAC